MRVEKGLKSELVNRNSIKCYTWDVPTAQWLGLCTPTAGARVPSLGRNEKFKEKFKTFF